MFEYRAFTLAKRRITVFIAYIILANIIISCGFSLLFLPVPVKLGMLLVGNSHNKPKLKLPIVPVWVVTAVFELKL